MEGITKCWCEEAHTLSQNSLEILEPTIRKEGSELWFSYNPKFETDPVHRMFVVDEPPPGAFVVKINWSDNPWFPEVLKTKLSWDKEKDHNKYLHIWEGFCVQFTDEQIMNGIWKIDSVPEPPAGTILRYGLDFGFGSDPFAANRLWIQGKKLYIDYEAHGHGVDIDVLPDEIKEIPGADKWPIVADSARPDSISYLNKNGLRVVGAKKGPNSIEDGISRIRGYEVIIDPRCKYTIEEFTKYSYKRDKQTDKILPIILDEFNHHIDEIRYATEGVEAKELYLDFTDIHAAIERDVDIPFGTPKIFGVFQNVICRRHGRKVEPFLVKDSLDPVIVSTFVSASINEYRPDVVIVNEVGIGAAIVDRLKQLGFQVFPIHSFAKSDSDKVPDKVTEMWGRVKEWLPGADIPGETPLTSDLLSQQYDHDSKQRIKVVKDKELQEWPSYGDALATTFAYPTPPVVNYSQESLVPEWAEDM
jgi:PBSX family phage terminase large subunit